MPDNPNLCFALRSAATEDRPFLVEMARQVCTLEGQPLAAADDPQVVAFLPDSMDAAVVAVDRSERRLGAVWWVLRELPLLRDPEEAAPGVGDSRCRGPAWKGYRPGAARRARGESARPCSRFGVERAPSQPRRPTLHPCRFQGRRSRTRVVRSRHESAPRPIAAFTRGHSRTLAPGPGLRLARQALRGAPRGPWRRSSLK